jgi:hypothetical protein
MFSELIEIKSELNAKFQGSIESQNFPIPSKKYAILEYSNELLSLSYIGRGNTLNYIPEKKTEDISSLTSEKPELMEKMKPWD